MSIEKAIVDLTAAIQESTEAHGVLSGKIDALIAGGGAAPAAAPAAAAAGSKKTQAAAAPAAPTVATVKKDASDFANRDKTVEGQKRLVAVLRTVAAALGVKKIGDIEEGQIEQTMGILGSLNEAYDAAVAAEGDPLEAVEAVEFDTAGNEDDSPI